VGKSACFLNPAEGKETALSTTAEIKRLFTEQGEKITLQKGEVLFHQNDASDAVYYVVSGSLMVYADSGDAGSLLLNKIEAGKLVGELGAITRQPRSATLVADSQVRLLAIPTPRFQALLAGQISLVESMTLSSREHLLSADRARIQFGKTHQKMQKRLASLSEEKEQLEELLRLREELEAMMIHDLRNPLNAVVISLDLLEPLRDQVKDPETFDRIITLAKNGAERMTGLVSTLLEIARLEAGKLTLNIGEFDLASLFTDVIAAQQPLAKESVRIINHAPPGLIIKADRDVFFRVIANLLDNALKFSPSGGRIDLAVQILHNRSVRVSVVDSGPGVPIGERERIFDKFTRIKDSAHRERGGTGLGLTFCRMAVEAHGGAIWVEDGPSGTGSCFCLQIPQD
jgi:signal transduction histidine kinase